jgi:iron complex outermembrane recepter protein
MRLHTLSQLPTHDHRTSGLSWRLTAMTIATLAACGAQAQSPAAVAAGAATEKITITGSRVSTIRTAIDTATPVDSVGREELAATGQVQLQNALSVSVPSFSVSKPSTAGALDFTSSPTLRGLGPGDTLLLVNGKRRHSMPALNLNNQIGRGDVG